MNKKQYLYSNLFAWSLVLFLIANHIFGWTTPTEDPPGGNITPSFSQWTTSGSDIYYNDGSVGIGTASPGAKLEVSGNIDSYNSKVASYSSLTGSAGDWFPLFTISDSTNATVVVNLKTYAHSSVTFIAAKGYASSNQQSVNVLDAVINANGGFANVVGLRIRQNGVVEAQLTWTSGPSVNIGIQIMGTVGTPTPVSSLVSTTETSTVVDTVALSTGMMRARGNIVASTPTADNHVATKAYVDSSGIPSGMIAMFTGSCPTGWTRFSALDGKFARGASSYGATGGSETHSHSTKYSTQKYSSGTYYAGAVRSGTLSVYSSSHLPPYLDVIWCQKN